MDKVFSKIFKLIILILIVESIGGYQKLVNQQSADQNVIEVKSRCLDSQNIVFNQFTPNITSTESNFDGYNLFVLEERNITSNFRNDTLIISDMEGNIKVKRQVANGNPALANYPVEFINSTTILLRIDNAIAFWNIEQNITQTFNFDTHHEVEYNLYTKTFLGLEYYKIEINGTSYVFDRINEYDMQGDVIWSLDTADFISPSQWCPFHDMSGENIDLIHSNTLFWDIEEDVIYYNSRNVNTFYKINHSSSEILWGLGEYGNFTLFDYNSNIKSSLFYHAHAVEKTGENSFILFDNDIHNQTNPNNKRSRILEITINITTMTANESWSWIAPPDYYSEWWGDADRLPNGNRLGTFGTSTHPLTNIGARLVEVNETGQIIWEMNFPRANEYLYGIYRMERFRFAPILNSPLDIFTLEGDNVTTTWQTWYNFRSKMDMNGSYSIYQNNQIIKTGVIKFGRFWKPIDLTFNFRELERGNHNLTLVIADEGNHVTIDSINIIVEPIYRTPEEESLTIELGHENSLVEWYGYFNRSLLCNISLDSMQLHSFVWNGSFIFNLNFLETGTHNITMALFNITSGLVFKDNFGVTVFPSYSPIVNLITQDNSVIWNDVLVLSWELFDRSPATWEIRVNGSLLISGNWDNKNYLLTWTLPILDEGIYNISLVVYDDLGQQTTKNTWITILSPSPPIISKIPTEIKFRWGQKDAVLVWEVHGGTVWEIWRNGSLFNQGIVTNQTIELHIEGWYPNNWLPGIYNITILIDDDSGGVVINSIWLQIVVIFGDAYANAVITENSLWYEFGENALVNPDNKSALIFVDYGNGYLTLDMGLNEEIIDGNGSDFRVFARGGEYLVRVGNDLSSPFTILGIGSGNNSFDLSTIDLASTRYVQIECWSGETIELDAIIAVYFNSPEYDTTPPQITSLEDFWVWSDQKTAQLSWEVYDLTPLNYSILVDDKNVATGKWIKSLITFTLDLTGKSNTVRTTLVLDDVFGNRATNTVTIEIRSRTTATTTNKRSTYSLFALTMGLTALLIWRKHKKEDL